MMNSRLTGAIRLALLLSGAVAGHAPSAYAQSTESTGDAPEVAATTSTASAEGEYEEIVVEGRLRAAAEDVVQERIELEVPADIVDAEQVAKLGDSSVSLALRRLPGVTLVNDQFIYVRGLGERYSSTTLNGASVPSPDLTRNVIPLDLFPANIIDSLAINKGFTADMPAAFGGGNVDIRTRSIPMSPFFSFKVGSGWNTNNDDDGLSYRGGDDDWLGSDDGTRALPDEIKAAFQQYQGDITPPHILDVLNQDGGTHTLEEAQEINRRLATSLYRDIDFQQKSMDPDVSMEAAGGSSWFFGGNDEWRIGTLALVDYGNQWRNKERINRSAQFPETTVTRTQTTTHQVNLTGSLNLGLQYRDDHKVEASGLYLRSTDDEASLALKNNNNFSRADGLQLRDYRIRFEERDLEVYQFRGAHTLGEDTLDLLGNWAPLNLARDLQFTWYYSDATATTDIPSEILVSAEDRVNPQTGEVIATAVRASTSSTEYRFLDLEDKVKSYGWELSKPFAFGMAEFTLAGGWERYEKGRSYIQTQLTLGTQALGTDDVRSGTPGQVLTDDNLLNSANGFLLSTGGTGTESYLAAEMIDAGYGKFDLMLNKTWRIAGGVRYEDFQRISLPVDALDFTSSKITTPVDQLTSLAVAEDDYYPSLALTYLRPNFWAEQFQLRLGWSKTVTRPDLREVSNGTYIEPLTDARITGNPNLQTADIANYDLRGEWFFGNGDSFTISGFYKDITNPIETVQGAGSDDIIAYSFINADSAEVYGVELEWLEADPLGTWFGDWTDDLFIAGNLTFSDSEITIGSQALNVTNNQRRLTQHAQEVFNLQLGYDAPNGKHSAALVYNVVGERVFFAGTNGAPDAYEQPFNSLDLNYSFYPMDSLTFKFRVQNILDDELEIKQGGVTVLEQSIGTTIKLDATLRF